MKKQVLTIFLAISMVFNLKAEINSAPGLTIKGLEALSSKVKDLSTAISRVDAKTLSESASKVGAHLGKYSFEYTLLVGAVWLLSANKKMEEYRKGCSNAEGMRRARVTFYAALAVLTGKAASNIDWKALLGKLDNKAFEISSKVGINVKDYPVGPVLAVLSIPVLFQVLIKYKEIRKALQYYRAECLINLGGWFDHVQSQEEILGAVLLAAGAASIKVGCNGSKTVLSKLASQPISWESLPKGLDNKALEIVYKVGTSIKDYSAVSIFTALATLSIFHAIRGRSRTIREALRCYRGESQPLI